MNQDLFRGTLLFAVEAHHRQLRKDGRIPYITHVVDVAESLAYYYPDSIELIMAGLLHDVVEDTPVSTEELQAQFGPEVAELVMAVTKPDDPELSFSEKRQATLTALTPDRPDVLRLKAADALSNLSSIRRDLTVTGEAAWARFKASKEESLGYYREIVARVRAGLEGEPLVLELEQELRGVEALSKS